MYNLLIVYVDFWAVYWFWVLSELMCSSDGMWALYYLPRTSKSSSRFLSWPHAVPVGQIWASPGASAVPAHIDSWSGLTRPVLSWAFLFRMVLFNWDFYRLKSEILMIWTSIWATFSTLNSWQLVGWETLKIPYATSLDSNFACSRTHSTLNRLCITQNRKWFRNNSFKRK